MNKYYVAILLLAQTFTFGANSTPQTQNLPQVVVETQARAIGANQEIAIEQVLGLAESRLRTLCQEKKGRLNSSFTVENLRCQSDSPIAPSLWICDAHCTALCFLDSKSL